MTDKTPAFDILLSYHYFPEVERVQQLAKAGANIILDSGAYSAFYSGQPIDIDAYADYCKQCEPYVERYFSLDAIGDISQSREQHAYLKSRGLDPVPVWQSHDHTFDGLQEFVCDEPFVAIGGLAIQEFSGSKFYNEKRIASFMRRVYDIAPETKIHLLGYGKPKWVPRFKPYSIDNASAELHFVYGEQAEFVDTRTHKVVQYQLCNTKRVTLEQLQAARHLVGCPPEQDNEGFRARNKVANVAGDFEWSRAVALARGLQMSRRIKRKCGTRTFVVTSSENGYRALVWLQQHANI